MVRTKNCVVSARRPESATSFGLYAGAHSFAFHRPGIAISRVVVTWDLLSTLSWLLLPDEVGCRLPYPFRLLSEQRYSWCRRPLQPNIGKFDKWDEYLGDENRRGDNQHRRHLRFGSAQTEHIESSSSLSVGVPAPRPAERYSVRSGKVCQRAEATGRVWMEAPLVFQRKMPKSGWVMTRLLSKQKA